MNILLPRPNTLLQSGHELLYLLRYYSTGTFCLQMFLFMHRLYTLDRIRYNDSISQQHGNHKGGENMEVMEMTEKELITITIDRYMDLQRIKKENGNHENKELEYQIKGVIAKLSSMDVNVEDITL